ncbi:Transcriptional regulator, HxlR family OS=Cystobacter fuscus DSM 2262 GN=D187_001862 PE=4 SV=1: HxlR [Gemmataceae bacterium]|nr:Transcriptional regulator, HxlR family OS=Cystobacter fuscus DSM 2262 GN=D187_001862 PE=4 SV=1: HxlR [Gemmataceae bacterium]VTT97005.1 Transcriptional regulator, HxlR family OS=Cystobacter fuscus DSM 2262 GN=D187_001862 PE=4 SV=1: HxlR [Gemmataceae bacterium]
MKRTCNDKEMCPIARSLETVGDWWALLIVRDALLGRRRFGEFLESLGVARNILTVRLKKLVADGVLEQVPASDGSSYKEYALTGKGRGLFVVLAALGQWSAGDEFSLVDRKKGKPVRVELRAATAAKWVWMTCGLPRP